MKIGDKKIINGTARIWGKCRVCGKEKWMFKSSFLKYCTRKCRDIAQSGEHCCKWKGGTYIHKGYLRFSAKELKHKLVHRHIIEQNLGRKLNKNERVHHINGIKTDNRIENLVVCKNNAEHIEEYHNKKEKHYYNCRICGVLSFRLPSSGLCVKHYNEEYKQKRKNL